MGGGETGLIFGNDIFRSKAYADFMLNVFDREYSRSKVGIESCLSVAKNVAFKGGYSFFRNHKENWHEWSASFNFFFDTIGFLKKVAEDDGWKKKFCFS